MNAIAYILVLLAIVYIAYYSIYFVLLTIGAAMYNVLAIAKVIKWLQGNFANPQPPHNWGTNERA